jgi:putative aminopeptidase FrvX
MMDNKALIEHIDRGFLTQLYQAYAPSRFEGEMIAIVKQKLDAANIKYMTNKCGNIYSFANPGRPMLSAHLDQVPFFRPKKSREIEFVELKDGDIAAVGVSRLNLGADDKNGVYIILKILETRPNLNFCFSVCEEVPATGIGKIPFKAHQEELAEIPYCLVLDRKGKGDIICAQNNYGVKKLEDDLAQVGTSFGYRPDRGMLSDADYLSTFVSCANLSVGYYNAHSEQEFTKLAELANAKKYVESVIDSLNGVRYPAPDKQRRWMYG